MFHRQFLPWVANIGTPNLRRWGVKNFPSALVRSMAGFVDYMHEQSVLIFEEKKKAMEQGDEADEQRTGTGKDIMNTLRKYSMRIQMQYLF